MDSGSTAYLSVSAPNPQDPSAVNRYDIAGILVSTSGTKAIVAVPGNLGLSLSAQVVNVPATSGNDDIPVAFLQLETSKLVSSRPSGWTTYTKFLPSEKPTLESLRQCFQATNVRDVDDESDSTAQRIRELESQISNMRRQRAAGGA